MLPPSGAHATPSAACSRLWLQRQSGLWAARGSNPRPPPCQFSERCWRGWEGVRTSCLRTPRYLSFNSRTLASSRAALQALAAASMAGCISNYVTSRRMHFSRAPDHQSSSARPYSYQPPISCHAIISVLVTSRGQSSNASTFLRKRSVCAKTACFWKAASSAHREWI